MRTERQQAAAALLSPQAWLMNRVSVFWWSCQTVHSTRAKPPVNCSTILLQQEQQCWLSWGGGGCQEDSCGSDSYRVGVTHSDSSDSHCFSFSVKDKSGPILSAPSLSVFMFQSRSPLKRRKEMVLIFIV